MRERKLWTENRNIGIGREREKNVSQGGLKVTEGAIIHFLLS